MKEDSLLATLDLFYDIKTVEEAKERLKNRREEADHIEGLLRIAGMFDLPPFFLDYGDCVNALVDHFDETPEEAFYIFEEAQDKGLFKNCENYHSAIIIMFRYYLEKK